jgi:putative transposase
MPVSGSGIRKTCKRWNEPWQAHELTFSCYRRRAFFGRDRTRQYLAQAVEQAKQKHAFHVWAYVIMPEHVHLLIWPAMEVYSISAILKSIKQSVSRKAVTWLKANNPAGLRCMATAQAGKPYQFWQDGGGYDRNIRNAKALREMMGYIHDNPVKRGLVERAEDWLWSSARDWAGQEPGPIPIDRESCLNSMT